MPARMIRSGGDYDERLIRIKKIMKLKAGEKIFINYYNILNNDKPIKFDANKSLRVGGFYDKKQIDYFLFNIICPRICPPGLTAVCIFT